MTWADGRSVRPPFSQTDSQSVSQGFGGELVRQVTSPVGQLDSCGYLPLCMYHVDHPEAIMHTDIPQALIMQSGLRPKRRSSAAVKKLMMRRTRPTSTVAKLGSMPLPTSCSQRVYVQQSQEKMCETYLLSDGDFMMHIHFQQTYEFLYRIANLM